MRSFGGAAGRSVAGIGLAFCISLSLAAGLGPAADPVEPHLDAAAAEAVPATEAVPADAERDAVALTSTLSSEAAAGSLAASPPVPTTLPGGRSKVFEDNSFLVAYYGTAQTGSLGVLGERSPARTMPRLLREARKFRRPGVRIQPVFELIVTVADGYPGGDGNFNHDIPRRYVRDYIAAAHRYGALLILDVQPGRQRFPEVVKRWEWALRDPWVGLAVDPEWRMGPHQVPGRVFGSVSAVELNQTAAWLSGLVARNGLPEKVFMIHQFRTDMIPGIARVRGRANLAMVQHVDGFGPPGAKLGTYHAVAHPDLFTMGFKLFYDEDRPRMSAARVLQIRPRVRFVSFQ